MLRALGLMALAFFQTLSARLRLGPLRPSWSFMFQAMVRYLRLDWERSADWDFPRLRAEVEGRPYPKQMVRRVDLRDDELGGVPAVVFAPRAARRPGAVLFFHGGSYIYGSARSTHAELLAGLAHDACVEVYGLEYRLAPEHPYPAQLEDALAAFDALVARGIPAERIVLAGDSAGGNLAIAAQIALRERGGARAGALALLSPWADLTMPGASFLSNERFDFGRRQELVRQAAAFAGDVPLDDPRISPVYARLHDLGPVFVSVGGVEIPKDDILALARALRDAGVPTRLHEADDMPHNPAVFAAYHPSGRAAFEALVGFVTESLG